MLVNLIQGAGYFHSAPFFIFMKQRKFSINSLLGYTVAAVTFIFGIGIIAGFFSFQHVPSQMRYTFAVVLILWAIYRSVVTYTNAKQREYDNRE